MKRKRKRKERPTEPPQRLIMYWKLQWTKTLHAEQFHRIIVKCMGYKRGFDYDYQTWKCMGGSLYVFTFDDVQKYRDTLWKIRELTIFKYVVKRRVQ